MKTLLLGILSLQLVFCTKRSFTVFKNGASLDIEDSDRVVKPRLDSPEDKPTAEAVELKLEQALNEPSPVISDLFDFAEITIERGTGNDIDSIIESLGWLDLESTMARPASVQPSAYYVPRNFDGMSFIDMYFEWSILADISGNGECSSNRCTKLFEHLYVHFGEDPTIQLLLHAFNTRHFSRLFSIIKSQDDILIHRAIYHLLSFYDSSYTPTAFSILFGCLDEYDFDLETALLFLQCQAVVPKEILEQVLSNMAEEIPDSSIIQLIMTGTLNLENTCKIVHYLEVSDDLKYAAMKHGSLSLFDEACEM